ncbi:MAG: hypothetical protein OXH47_10500 [Paracoccaceae bacterium]|nr:hypothetical protein [Paracoccaceae bacterium]
MTRTNSSTASFPDPGILYRTHDGSVIALRDRWFREFNPQSGELKLPTGIWFTCGLEPGNPLFKPTSDHILPTDGWFGITIGEIASEWGLNPIRKIHHLQLIFWILKRILLLSFLMINASSQKRIGREFLLDDIQCMLMSPTLYKVINQHQQGLQKQEKKLHRIIPPMKVDPVLFRPVVDKYSNQRCSDQPITCARFPRFAYVSDLASMPLPREGSWKKIQFVEPGRNLTQDYISHLSKIDLPILCYGKFIPKPQCSYPWDLTWQKGMGRKVVYTFKEVEILMEYGSFRIESFFAGPGWDKSSSANSYLVRSLDELTRICGGAKFANLSWSANIVAQSLFQGCVVYSCMRNQPLSSKFAWLVAEDRIRMLPLLKLLIQKGASIFSACGGEVRFQLPLESTEMKEIASEFSALGVTLSVCQKGNSREQRWDDRNGVNKFMDYPGRQSLQYLIHNRLGKWLWRYDSLIGLPPEEKEARFNALCIDLGNHHA